MCQDQPLPVTVKDIFAAFRSELHTRASFTRLQQKMHFRIMPQWLEMSDSLCRSGDRLFIYDPALSELCQDSVPFLDQVLQHFCLHLTHKLDMYFLRLLCPDDVELRFFLLKLPQVQKHCMDVTLFRQFDPISQDRFEHRDIRI